MLSPESFFPDNLCRKQVLHRFKEMKLCHLIVAAGTFSNFYFLIINRYKYHA